jgi:predicted nucleotidyltransferase
VVEKSILKSVVNYIETIKANGIEVERAIVFGSQVTGRVNEWSDIDLIVISPSFDDMKDRSILNLLWRLAARTDSRIEPVLCGSRQWQEDDAGILFEIARKEGEEVVIN